MYGVAKREKDSDEIGVVRRKVSNQQSLFSDVDSQLDDFHSPIRADSPLRSHAISFTFTSIVTINNLHPPFRSSDKTKDRALILSIDTWRTVDGLILSVRNFDIFMNIELGKNDIMDLCFISFLFDHH
ncbi:hypothetical protein E3N88_41516 [Mikania micrantha]|uniref:Uncharacterized protein n=1 Tax=Mikania micrantha TaxID=192012 RepID=A0A5N6LKL3_9ASTR|nr:hypothetical protein E3N88_41516 [Mikania micrantha]